jgi:hypothetical protein
MGQTHRHQKMAGWRNRGITDTLGVLVERGFFKAEAWRSQCQFLAPEN